MPVADWRCRGRQREACAFRSWFAGGSDWGSQDSDQGATVLALTRRVGGSAALWTQAWPSGAEGAQTRVCRRGFGHQAAPRRSPNGLRTGVCLDPPLHCAKADHRRRCRRPRSRDRRRRLRFARCSIRRCLHMPSRARPPHGSRGLCTSAPRGHTSSRRHASRSRRSVSTAHRP